ncbi:hypothetical protein AGMMS50230_04340 [Spirochaetia bacterium]|nr:hypothetical protein AGMMS50230_04340 [Spirochaetia bacterium]
MKTLKIMALVLILGTLFSGAVSAKDPEPVVLPVITGITTLTTKTAKRLRDSRASFDYSQTTFVNGDIPAFVFKGRIGDNAVTKCIVVLKKEGVPVDIGKSSTLKTNIILKENSNFDEGFWGWRQASKPGNYTFEVYIVDSQGNQSNTVSVDFIVLPK